MDDMLVARTVRMYKQHIQNGPDLYKVEKSKCVMHEHFRQHRLPHARIYEIWDEVKKFLHALEGIRDDHYSGTIKFPFMIKFCHLTQGTQFSLLGAGGTNTMLVANRQQLKTAWVEIIHWVLTAWSLTPRDQFRPWSRSAHPA